MNQLKRRPRVYISGPISNGGSASFSERAENVRRAAQVMLDLMEDGFAVQCPQLTEYAERVTGRHMAHSLWLENDFPWVEVSDAVLRLPGESTGSDMEVAHAGKYDVPVFTDVRAMQIHFGLIQ